MRKKIGTLILAACLYPLVALSHHSGAMFDRERTVSITGVVQEFLWNNPHSSIKLQVSERGAPVIWAIEMNGPNNLVHEGWKRNTLKAGDKVTILVNPLRSGQPGGWYVSITLPDGTTLGRPAGAAE
jgi:hypothetical protein